MAGVLGEPGGQVVERYEDGVGNGPCAIDEHEGYGVAVFVGQVAESVVRAVQVAADLGDGVASEGVGRAGPAMQET